MAPEKDLFEEDTDEPEILPDLDSPRSTDEKLDVIIDLLKKNELEHQEIRDKLKDLQDDMTVLRAAYQQHGKTLGEIMAQMNGHFGAHP